MRWGRRGSGWRARPARFEKAKAWSARQRRWLRALAFDDASSQATSVGDLAGVELLAGRRGTLLAVLEQQIPRVRTRR